MNYYGFKSSDENEVVIDAWFHTREAAERFGEKHALDSSLISVTSEINEDCLMDEFTSPWTNDDPNGKAEEWRGEVASKNFFMLTEATARLSSINTEKKPLEFPPEASL